MNKRHLKTLLEVLSLPTAPFAEDYVRRYIFDFCQRRRLGIREDRAGNIRVHYKHPSAKRSRPLCLCGHMDHPGFRAARTASNGLLKAHWYGGVRPEYFRQAKVRFYCDGRWILGQVRNVEIKTLGLEKPQKMVETAEVRIRGPKGATVKAGSPGMWDFPDPQIKGQKVYARACDDLAGCSAMLSCLDELVRQRAKTEAYFLFTRAEEVGFIGALAACRQRTVPKRCCLVAVETSAVLPGVEMGGGPVLRVGDKSSVFDPGLTAWCARVADRLATQDKTFTYQRKLMDGGTCESSAYCQLGYDATGMCVALGNYHNCDRKKKKLAPEFIHLADLANLIKWFYALAISKSEPLNGDMRLVKRMRQLERRYERLLAATV